MSALDGRSAFPSHGSMGEVEHRGMSLRDWFAGQALPIARAVFEALDPEDVPDNVPGYIAFVSYDIADAMLAQRAKFYDAEAKS